MRSLRLRPPLPSDEKAARAAHQELLADRFSFLLDWDPSEPWSGYLGRLDETRRGLGCGEDRVPATFLMAVVGGEVVGRSSVRHRLNDYLAAFAGHIGYAVLPEYRRHGYATEILRQSLVVARSVGLDRVLLTCDEDNVGSAAVIERCGGEFEGLVEEEEGRPRKRRYWFD